MNETVKGVARLLKISCTLTVLAVVVHPEDMRLVLRGAQVMELMLVI